MPRPCRVAYEGAIYHVTIRGNNDEVVFRDDQDRRTYLERVTRAGGRHAMGILAYVLMTNHVHLIVRTRQANISAAMQWLHGCYAALFNRRHVRRGHLFGDRFFSSVIDRDEYLLESTRYVHLNPVRADLVQRPEDYDWSSYRKYFTGDQAAVPIERDSVLEVLSADSSQRESLYRRFVEDALAMPRMVLAGTRGSRIATAAAAAAEAVEIPYAAVSRQAPGNRIQTLVMAALRRVGGLSAPEIAEYFGVQPRTVITAAWRLARRAERDRQLSGRVETMRVAAAAALRALDSSRS